MEKIVFARVLRDCKHNDEIKAASGKRGLIYDFMVIIDGEHRATWRKDAAGRGYILRTPNADPLRMQISNGLASHKRVFKQAKFETAIREALDASLIPRRDKNEASRVHIVDAADRLSRGVAAQHHGKRRNLRAARRCWRCSAIAGSPESKQRQSRK